MHDKNSKPERRSLLFFSPLLNQISRISAVEKSPLAVNFLQNSKNSKAAPRGTMLGTLAFAPGRRPD